MKKVLSLICAVIITVLIVVFFAACTEEKEIINKTPIDCRYTPASQELVTDYEYKYNWWTGDFELVPNIHTETLPERYEVYYKITYIDGEINYCWKEVSKNEYEKVLGER